MGFGLERGDTLRIRLWARDGGRCGICLRPIDLSELTDRSRINIDHIRPKAHGGTSRMENLQVAHERCNTAKGDDCVGCETCAAEQFSNARRVATWRAQRHQCYRCLQIILPSYVNDPGKVVASIGGGMLRLGHSSCEPADDNNVRYNNTMIQALVGVALRKGQR